MEQLLSEIIGTPVMVEDVRPLTSVKNLVIDNESGKILAFVVDAHKNKIIAPIDVIEWRRRIIRIHNHESIIDGDEVLRVKKVQETNIKILGSKVETVDGLELGRVYDYSVDNKNLCLKNLYVAKGIVMFFRYEKKIISWKHIVEILPGKIIVKDGLAQTKEIRKLQRQGI